MTEKMKIWTKEDVARLLGSIKPEDSKNDVYAINYYLDPGDPEDSIEPTVFIVWEWVLKDEPNVLSATVRGNKDMGWLQDALYTRKSREEYGDVGDHCLVSEDEARLTLASMGLNVEDGKRLLINDYLRIYGFPPNLLPEDPKWKARRDKDRARLGLPPKE